MARTLVRLLLAVATTICLTTQNVESGAPIKLSLYSKIMYGCGFQGMPCQLYYSSINMGNGVAQPIKVGLDTCFNDLFVPLRGQGHGPLHYNSGFDPTRSTYFREEMIKYAYSTLTGRWYSDYMSLSANSWFAMTFMVAQTSSQDLSYAPWDGVLGLGPRAASQAGTSNLLMSLYQQNVTNLLQFGLWFDDQRQYGEITLGGMDSGLARNLQPFRRQDYANSHFWWIPLRPVTMNNQIIGCDRGDCHAIIHSGISDIYGPKQQVYRIYHSLGIDYDRDRHTYVDCRIFSSNIVLGFTFEGQTRYLTAPQYVKSFNDGSHQRCYVPIYPTETQDAWILGTTFLSNYYTAVDAAQNIILMSY